MVLAACFGPRHPKNSSFLSSSAFVARKKRSNSSRARDGMADVLQIGLERRAVWHRKHAVVSLLLAFVSLHPANTTSCGTYSGSGGGKSSDGATLWNGFYEVRKSFTQP
jgi:hypothetical protein